MNPEDLTVTPRDATRDAAYLIRYPGEEAQYDVLVPGFENGYIAIRSVSPRGQLVPVLAEFEWETRWHDLAHRDNNAGQFYPLLDEALKAARYWIAAQADVVEKLLPPE